MVRFLLEHGAAVTAVTKVTASPACTGGVRVRVLAAAVLEITKIAMSVERFDRYDDAKWVC